MQALLTSPQTPLAVKTYTQPRGFRTAVPLVATDRPLLAALSLSNQAGVGQMLPPAATDQSLHRIPSKYSLAPSPRGKQGAQQAG